MGNPWLDAAVLGLAAIMAGLMVWDLWHTRGEG